ncbi:hypothetical protein VSQ48_23975 [Candidatus Ventrimonas sp. KK005]
MKKIHWSVKAAYVYLVFFLMIQILAFIYTTYKTIQIKKAYIEFEAQDVQQSKKDDSTDAYFEFNMTEYFCESVQPISDAGKIAKTATPILVLNVSVSAITTLFLILPTFVMDKITEYVYKCGGNIDIDTFRKFRCIIFVINTLIIFFDLYATKVYWDFANAFIK